MRVSLRNLGVLVGGVTVLVLGGQLPAQAATGWQLKATNGKCWDIQGESSGSGAVVQLYSCKGNVVWQNFGIFGSQIGTGYLKCVAVDSGAIDSGLSQRDCNSADSKQHWTKISPGGDVYTFQNVYSGLCATDTGISGGGSRVQLRMRECDGSAAQRFKANHF
ncbi:MAG TPA: ricin-type beta-trefoil lectin domain protein [Actinokineospora sp.]|jgi:hypothetical protein|nr:ricin-type beta-trefoil lectin domain protein [Actinokineospora sp.]